MEQNLYNKKYYNTNYPGLEGEIEIKDFNTYTTNKNCTSNQADAQNFHKKLDKIKKEKYLENKYKNMSIEELRQIKVISNTDGRPPKGLTNNKWQLEFNIRKLFIHPYGNETTKLGGKYSREAGTWNGRPDKSYIGCTNWQSYCSFINDILKNIRSGQTDYCYYIYQIMHLAKFHKETLKTRYCDGYWEVWLESPSQPTSARPGTIMFNGGTKC